MREHTIKTEIGDCLEVAVNFEYEPRQAAILNGPMMQPEIPEELNIHSVMFGEADLLQDLSFDCLKRIEEQCFDHLTEAEAV